jgi:hypothetical protein
MKNPIIAAILAVSNALCATPAANAATPGLIAPIGSDGAFDVAQAMVPPTGMDDAQKSMSPEARMRRRFPQPVRVGDLVGLRVLDDQNSTIGIVRKVVRTPQDKVEFIVAYGGWFGWGAHLVAVPIEVVGIEGRQLASLDMPRKEYAAAPAWQDRNAAVLPDDATVRVALSRR